MSLVENYTIFSYDFLSLERSIVMYDNYTKYNNQDIM